MNIINNYKHAWKFEFVYACVQMNYSYQLCCSNVFFIWETCCYFVFLEHICITNFLNHFYKYYEVLWTYI